MILFFSGFLSGFLIIILYAIVDEMMARKRIKRAKRDQYESYRKKSLD